MAESTETREKWLVAAWPGMGSVAMLAGMYLLDQLRPRRAGELNSADFFEVKNVEVKNGIAVPGPLPRSMFFEWTDPHERHDLLFFIGQAQPDNRGYSLCEAIVNHAIERGVTRLFTFAAMATQLNLGTQPRVFAAATDVNSLNQVNELGVEILNGGQIGGLNGVLLAASAQRGLHGTCLLGELPFFAVGVPNPRAAQAVVEYFTQLAGIQIDLTGLERQAESVERNLQQLLEQMHRAAAQAREQDTQDEEENPGDAEESEKSSPPAPALDPRIERKIATLFEKVRQDRSKAVELKQELDRWNVFKQYEDRFLDLFRKGE